MLNNLIITLLAYLIDRVFGEFRFVKHPVVYIGELISLFEKKLYKDSLTRGCLLVILTLAVSGSMAVIVSLYLGYFPAWLNTLLTSLIASMFVAHNMLRERVLDVANSEDKKEAIAHLVSRDTENLSESDIHKAAIESYAENLSDGVVAPLFYLLLFNLPGIVVYKTINTMDSMIGYKNARYEKFGKCAARLDDLANFIPSRITALLIMLFGKKLNIFAFYKDGKKHDSPNAGHPITAMALVLGIQLGGDTAYFGKLKKKATFGSGRERIQAEDIKKALNIL